MKDKRYHKVGDHCHYTDTGEYRDAVHSICNLKYSVPKKSSITFHNGSNYDNHFIIKELPEEFTKQFTYLGEKSPAEKEFTRIDKNGEEFTKNIWQFMESSLSNLVNNFSKVIHKIKF